jgi:hypothetical protein
MVSAGAETQSRQSAKAFHPAIASHSCGHLSRQFSGSAPESSLRHPCGHVTFTVQDAPLSHSDKRRAVAGDTPPLGGTSRDVEAGEKVAFG